MLKNAKVQRLIVTALISGIAQRRGGDRLRKVEVFSAYCLKCW